MAPRRMKDRRPLSDVKDEPVVESTSFPSGDDLSLKKKRGRPRKSSHSAAFTDRDGDEYFEDAAELDEDAALSEDDSYQDEEKGSLPTIAKDAGSSANGASEQKREPMMVPATVRKAARRAPLQHVSKDGLDLQSELLIKCLQGRGSHRRKGKPTRATQASF